MGDSAAVAHPVHDVNHRDEHVQIRVLQQSGIIGLHPGVKLVRLYGGGKNQRLRHMHPFNQSQEVRPRYTFDINLHTVERGPRII